LGSEIGQGRSSLTRLEGATLALLLALAGTVLTGYRYGDSNHGITVPILKRLMDASLYPGDVMVATADKFPTVFYRALALLLPNTDWIPVAFFVLYVVAIAATLAGAWRLGMWAGGPGAAWLALLFAFPVRIGLAGEALYRVEFSHSHLASALVIWAMVWFLEGRRLLPLLVLSLGAYNHLLYSAYVLVPMVLVVLAERRERGTKRTLQLLAAAALPLVPIAAWSVSRGTPMTAEWLELLKLRSSHHSFPSGFAGDLPDAAALLALAALSASRLPSDRRALLALFLVGTALQFLFGTLFTEYWPLKAVLQYQPHRSWRFLQLLLQAVIAAGVVQGFRAGGVGRLVALLTGVVVFLPGLESLLPLVVIAQAAASRPPAATWARLLAASVLAFLGGWGDKPLDFTTFLLEMSNRMLSATVLTAAALALLVRIGYEKGGFTRRALSGLAALLTLVWFMPDVYARARARFDRGAWIEVQKWARQNTPKSAVFLTPPREAGFRVFSERTSVGEWKDGTQQYFDDAFVREWGLRMEILGDLPKRNDEELRQIAQRLGATHIVLPARQERAGFAELYRNRDFAVYRAR
jgi:hypothetical protein